MSYSKGERSLRDEIRLTTDGGPELPGQSGGGSHSHGWRLESGHKWSVTRDRGSLVTAVITGGKGPQGVSRSTTSLILVKCHDQCISNTIILYNISWFLIKTKGWIIRHPKHQSLYPCYIITSPIVIKELVKH